MAYGNATPKRLGLGLLSNFSSATAYTVPANKGAIVKVLHVEQAGTSNPFSLSVQAGGAGAFRVVWSGKPTQQDAKDGGAIVMHAKDLNIPLSAGDVLVLTAVGSGGDYYIGGVEFDV